MVDIVLKKIMVGYGNTKTLKNYPLRIGMNKIKTLAQSNVIKAAEKLTDYEEKEIDNETD
jgi:hypothetical protein